MTEAIPRRISKKGNRVYVDWITWSVWAFGLALLLYWCYETIRELKNLFARRRNRAAGD